MKTNIKANMKDTVKMHPISTALFIIYFIISVLQGNTDLLIARGLAASAAWALELIFCVTGMIKDWPLLCRPAWLRQAPFREDETRRGRL